jgi:murein DD-endopeptidase MepM/ murein hydrolase activator NlpD
VLAVGPAVATVAPGAIAVEASPKPAPAPVLAPPCPARDPEDGRCYPSADAADLAWLGRAPGAESAAPDEDDAEEGLEAPDPPSFWRSLGDGLRSLVVRRSDGKPVAVPEEELEALFGTGFPLPIEAYDRAKLRDTFLARRGRAKKHYAIDLGARRGTPVVAVADGVIERLGRDRHGGKVVYLRDLTGRYTFYYAHLRVHEKGMKAGDHVSKGQRLGEVGATGRVIGGPHLHFAIYRNEAATDSRHFAVNPYLIFSALSPR